MNETLVVRYKYQDINLSNVLCLNTYVKKNKHEKESSPPPTPFIPLVLPSEVVEIH